MSYIASCPYCRATHDLERSGTVSCGCGREFDIYVFNRPARAEPAPAAGAESAAGAAAAEAKEGSVPCANHRGNPATATCVRCGDFICDLCVVEEKGRPFCPKCFEHRLGQAGSGAPQRAQQSANTALTVSLLGVVVGLCTGGMGGIALGVVAVFLAERARRELEKTGAPSGRSKAIAATVIGMLCVIGYGLLFLAVMLS